MGKISVDKVEPGMVLAEKVLTPKNMMLLPEGVTITEGHMLTFRTWGISEVNVVGEGDSNGHTELTEEEQEALEQEVREIFKHNDLSGEFTAKLFEIACTSSGGTA